MDTVYKARAVCNHDAMLVKAALSAKNGKRKTLWHVKRPTVSGNILTFTVTSNEYHPHTGLSVLALLLTKDELLDCHRLVGTVAPAETFTGEVIDENYTTYDSYLKASRMTDAELLEALCAQTA